jgi:solute carrier family 8 (sodium/calcium exchanger)
MEKEGLVRGIDFFKEKGISIGHFVSDRHLQVAKWVRENLPDTRHSIDVWHVAKGI